MAMKKIILLFIVAVLIVSGCTQNDFEPPEEEDEILDEITPMEEIELGCIAMCLEQINLGADISSGPCLVNNIGENPEGSVWVCDVAHDPRQDVDDNPNNQCEDYRLGIATHFVEVDEECNVIRSV